MPQTESADTRNMMTTEQANTIAAIKDNGWISSQPKADGQDVQIMVGHECWVIEPNGSAFDFFGEMRAF